MRRHREGSQRRAGRGVRRDARPKSAPNCARRSRCADWTGGDADVERERSAAPTSWSRSAADALRAIRAACAPDATFVPFGHRASAGYVDARSAADTTSTARGRAPRATRCSTTATAASRCTCSSSNAAAPRALERFTDALAAACERDAGRVSARRARAARARPRRRTSPTSAAFRAADGSGRVLATARGAWSVVVDPPRDELPPFGAGVIPLFIVDGLRRCGRLRRASTRIPMPVRRSRCDTIDPRDACARLRRGAHRAARRAARPAARRPSRRPRAHRRLRPLDRPRVSEHFERIVTRDSRAAFARADRARRALRSARRHLPRRRLSDRLESGARRDSSPTSTATATSTSPRRSASPRSATPTRRSTAAIAEQAAQLVHGMGDVHPTDVKARLLASSPRSRRATARERFFGSSGAEAIEFALKTALLATGRPYVLAYHGAYHGLSLGALRVGGIARFREPFAPLLEQRTVWLPYPDAPRAGSTLRWARCAAALAAQPRIGAIVVEPIQGRGGVIVPPDGYLRGLRAICDETETVLVLDEIYTGFGRTGTLFACEREGVVPDILCIGKAIAGGVPFSAAIGRPAVIDAWPPLERRGAAHARPTSATRWAARPRSRRSTEFERRALPAQRARAGAASSARSSTCARSGGRRGARARDAGAIELRAPRPIRVVQRAQRRADPAAVGRRRRRRSRSRRRWSSRTTSSSRRSTGSSD